MSRSAGETMDSTSSSVNSASTAESEARVLSAAVAGIQVLDVVHAVVAVPARLRLGGGVGRDAGGERVARAGGLRLRGRVGHAGHAQGGAADDAGGHDREGEGAGDVDGHFLSSPVSVSFSAFAPVCCGDDLTMPAPALVVCPVIGQRWG